MVENNIEVDVKVKCIENGIIQVKLADIIRRCLKNPFKERRLDRIMGAIPRNAMKGYSYQQSIFILFLALMDTERKISKITVEAVDTKHFDDIYVENVRCEEFGLKSYRIQAKNYPNTTLEDVVITDHLVSVKGNQNDYDSSDNNILVINSNLINTDSLFMGLPCVIKKGIIIIPITPEQCAEKIDNMFSSEERALQIIHKADAITQNAKFEISIDELPAVIEMSVDLENETILLRKVPEDFPYQVTWIEGKPGVGKSHFVNEICDKYPDAIVYRFWIGSQDPYRNYRLQFENFIKEFGVKVYKSAKRVIIDDLIDVIRKEDKLIVIDGLDHVENYNPSQLEQYVEFINKLQNIRVIVLSRPLRKMLTWNKDILLDWTIDETRVYLGMVHQIHYYKIQRQIFNITNGYPIITYFVAADYTLNGKVKTADMSIKGINDYYDSLFVNQDKPSEAISIFSVGNCFFTWNELKTFYTDPELFDIIQEFVKTHPYLFKIIANRVSLIHDSFNTYLREKLTSFPRRKEITLEIVRKSLLKGSVEYMDRMQSFPLDDLFYDEMLKKYADFEEFKRLMHSTRDYNSIASLYLQLQKQLETRKETLDIYQLYSFSLLFEISQRNDLIGSDSMVFQMLKYMHSHEGIEDCIFSSAYIWHVYLVCKQHEKMAERYLANKNMSKHQYYELLEAINSDCKFFEKKASIIKFTDIEKNLQDHEDTRLDVILADYFISIWINGNSDDKFYDLFTAYIDGDKNCIIEIEQELKQYNIDHFWIEMGLSSAEYQLHELGYFEEKNKFRNSTLEDIIRKGAIKGSFEAVTLAESYLKLANHEKRDVDIENLAFAWSSYYEHKDYSVYTIEKALIVFETEGLLEEDESFELIAKLMNQSDKGISHLITDYINQKGVQYIEKLIKHKVFSDKNNPIRFWELEPALLDCFNKTDFATQFTELLGVHYHSKNIEYRDIASAMQSKYKGMVLDGIEYYEYSILSPPHDLYSELDSRGIRYYGNVDEEKKEYIPLNYGCIHEDDFAYIKQKKIGYLDVAKYADGWYSCLPYVEVFSMYNKAEIQKDYLNIIHESMFARCSEGTYIGNWHLLIGNIIQFLKQYQITVDYSKLYGILIDFLDVSLIWHKKNTVIV